MKCVCTNNCVDCRGCAKGIYVTNEEVHILRSLGEIPFLPVGRKADDMTPVCLEFEGDRELCSAALIHLQAKDLIDIDYRSVLKGWDMTAYQAWPVHGVISLTLRGQQVLDNMELMGIG